MKRVYILFAITSFLAMACEEEINVDLNKGENKRLVVEGGITTANKSHSVKLTYTTDYFSEEPTPYASGAEVSISDGTNNYPLLEESESPGVYKTDPATFKAVPSRMYTLKIKLANGEEYTAKDSLPPVSDIDSIGFGFDKVPFNDIFFYKVLFYGQDPPQKGNYYLWDLYLDGKLYNDTLSETAFQPDDFVNGSYVRDFEIYWLLEDEIKQDTTDVTVEMLGISQGYYKFLIELLSETAWSGGMFSGAPANVSTNVSNGGIGYFYSADVDTFSTQLIRDEKLIEKIKKKYQ